MNARPRSLSPTASAAVKAEPDAPEAETEADASATVSAGPSTAAGVGNNSNAPPPSGTIHMRCLIVTQDASIIIGKGGAHVNEIRQKSGARVMVSESIPGNPERILNVSGPLDAVSKVRAGIAQYMLMGSDELRRLSA
jgi:heterogeneous nuclear rnp K-like protein